MLPLCSHIKDNMFKLILNDTGMLLEKSGYNSLKLIKGNEKIYLGLVIETYVGNVLSKKYKTLTYFQKNTTEIDYIIQEQNDVVPVEVKAGSNTRAKSLSVYLNRYEPKLAIKVSRKNLSYNFKVLNLPLYLFEAFMDGQLNCDIKDFL